LEKLIKRAKIKKWCCALALLVLIVLGLAFEVKLSNTPSQTTTYSKSITTTTNAKNS